LEDEEDFTCPPALETVEVQQQQLTEREREFVQQEEIQNNNLNDIGQQSAGGTQPNFNQAIVRELAIAIKESMTSYQDMGENYEPSADELIDVLKNLENLAAINPALYRAIVDQIKSKCIHIQLYPTFRNVECSHMLYVAGWLHSTEYALKFRTFLDI
jgi:hypothetical protein